MTGHRRESEERETKAEGGEHLAAGDFARRDIPLS